MGVLLLGALTFAFALADNAAAQQNQSTVIYAAYPSDLVSITADKQIIVLSQPSTGIMTATVVGTSFIFSGGQRIQNPNLAPGMTLITMRFLASCSLVGGCDAFGLQGMSTSRDRIDAFQDMSVETMRQFIASGANANEDTEGSYTTAGRLIYVIANKRIDPPLAVGEAHPNLAQMSLLVAAGANVNITISTGETMLHRAITQQNRHQYPLRAMLAMPGISVNVVDSGGRTPLDEIAWRPSYSAPSPRLRQNATLMYNAGGRCQLPLSFTNNPDLCNME